MKTCRNMVGVLAFSCAVLMTFSLYPAHGEKKAAKATKNPHDSRSVIAEDESVSGKSAITIENFHFQVHKQGAMLQEIEAQYGHLDQQENIIDMHNMKVKIYNEITSTTRVEASSGAGKVWLKARPAERIANRDFQLTGGVTLHAMDGLVLQTPQLRYSSRDNTLRSDHGFKKQIQAAEGIWWNGQGERFEIELTPDQSNIERIIEYGQPYVLRKTNRPELTP